MAYKQTKVIAEGPDHVVLAPDEHLRERASVPGLPGPDMAAIERAEMALKQLSVSFDNWMGEEVDALTRKRDAAVKAGFSDASLSDLFHCAHDIKGQADTLGFPLAAGIAASLCYLIDHMPDRAKIPPVLVNQHVDAIRAVLRERAKGQSNRTAAQLITSLNEITQALIERESVTDGGEAGKASG